MGRNQKSEDVKTERSEVADRLRAEALAESQALREEARGEK